MLKKNIIKNFRCKIDVAYELHDVVMMCKKTWAIR